MIVLRLWTNAFCQRFNSNSNGCGFWHLSSFSTVKRFYNVIRSTQNSNCLANGWIIDRTSNNSIQKRIIAIDFIVYGLCNWILCSISIWKQYFNPFFRSQATNSSFDMSIYWNGCLAAGVINVMSMAWRKKRRKKTRFFFVRIVWTAIEITPVYNIYGVLSVAHGSHSNRFGEKLSSMLNAESTELLIRYSKKKSRKWREKKFYKWMNEEYPNDEPSVSTFTSQIPFSVWIILNIFARSGILFFVSFFEKTTPKTEMLEFVFFPIRKICLFTIVMRF